MVLGLAGERSCALTVPPRSLAAAVSRSSGDALKAAVDEWVSDQTAAVVNRA